LFVFGDLAAAPQRAGKPPRTGAVRFVQRPSRNPYRVLNRIDEEAKLVTLLSIAHRAEVYRPGNT
jgi:mRNA interferase RelE/StbE